MRDSRFFGDLRRFRKNNRKYERLCTKYDKYITIYFEKVGNSVQYMKLALFCCLFFYHLQIVSKKVY